MLPNPSRRLEQRSAEGGGDGVAQHLEAVRQQGVVDHQRREEADHVAEGPARDSTFAVCD